MTDLRRRGLLQAAACASLLAHLPALAARSSSASTTAAEALKLWYRLPARQWVDALPLGNGRFGAMVWGGTSRERLQLNEDTLFAGAPYDANPEDALPALAEVRQLIFEGRYIEAEALANQKLMSKPVRQMPYQALGDVWLDLDGIGDVSGYRRELDLDTAIAVTEFRSGDTTYRRETFISPVDQCLVLRLSADRAGAIDGWLSAASEQQNQVSVEQGELLM
ncbi:MAG TPA: glycoside hydrolase family 95 protein, partial [Pseudoxanthomonas sp.]|nr:glycoside hydrolase family 95 protein [Pseudoxanthomonas sp.]